MKSMLCLLTLLLVFTSCARKTCWQFDVMGLCEFAEESQIAGEGKYGIMDLEGKCTEIDEGMLAEYADLIAEDDRLNIAVYHPSRADLMISIAELSQRIGGFRVQNGYVQLPGYEPVKVVGLSLNQAREKIAEEMRRDIKDVDVFIVFASRPSHKVEVSGMSLLADVPVDGKVRLYEVLAKAKVPPMANLHGSYVLRDNQFIRVDMVRLLKQGDMSQNIVMMPQDKVYIASPDDASIVVMGEINRVGMLPLLKGYMSLREALVLSGGIPFTGDKDNINVIRANGPCLKVFVLSWCDLIHYPAEQQLLIPGDVVYVSSKPITEWNRFMDDLRPTLVNIASADIIIRFMRR